MSWGPTTKRNVAGIYLTKLWNRDRFTPQQTAAILARETLPFMSASRAKCRKPASDWSRRAGPTSPR